MTMAHLNGFQSLPLDMTIISGKGGESAGVGYSHLRRSYEKASRRVDRETSQRNSEIEREDQG